MARIRIYHNILQNPEEVNETDSWTVAKYKMTHVATSLDADLGDLTEAEILEKYYELSNHIDRPWPLNPEWMFTSKHPRSTSVGDVISINDIFYEVSGFGFKEVKEVR